MRGSRFVGADSIRKTRVWGSAAGLKWEQPAGISKAIEAKTNIQLRRLTRAPMNEFPKNCRMTGARRRRQIVRAPMKAFARKNRKRQGFFRFGFYPEPIG